MDNYDLKLLIVDDKRVEREGIRGIFDWKSIGIAIVGEAENGTEGIEKARALRPDIIITDIVMPQSDGFKMIQEIKSFIPDIKVIFISCFDNFNFVKSAIDLDAMGYVLKPIISGELLATVSKVTGIRIRELERSKEEEELLRRLKESFPVLREQFYRDLLLGAFDRETEIWDKNHFLDAGLAPGRYTVMIMESDGYDAKLGASSEIDRQLVRIKMAECMASACAQSGLGDGFPIAAMDKSRFALILHAGDDEPALATEALADAVKRSVYDQFGLELTIGVSNPGQDILQVGRCYQEACDALKFKSYLGNNQAINYADVYADSSRIARRSFNAEAAQNDLKYLLRTGVRDEIDQFVEQLFPIGDDGNGGKSDNGDDGEQEWSRQYVQSICISIISFIQINLIEHNESLSSLSDNEFVVTEHILNYDTLANLKQQLKQIIGAVSSHLNAKQQPKNKKVIDTIREFIQTRYQEDLSVSGIAASVYLSPCYTNYMFRKETGETLMSYLAGIRIEKAKHLLRSSLLKVYEISEKVGYKNNSYFSSVFKEHCGMTPLEYRDRSVL